jgi:hypothetical protein
MCIYLKCIYRNVDGLSIVDFAGEHPIDVFMAITNGHSIEKTCPEGSLQRVIQTFLFMAQRRDFNFFFFTLDCV